MKQDYTNFIEQQFKSPLCIYENSPECESNKCKTYCYIFKIYCCENHQKELYRELLDFVKSDIEPEKINTLYERLSNFKSRFNKVENEPNCAEKWEGVKQLLINQSKIRPKSNN